MSASSHHASSSRPALLLVAVVLGLYILAALAGWPQQIADEVAHEADHPAEVHPATPDHGPPAAAEEAPTPPPYWAALPFVLLLLCIAVLPLVPRTAHWWESNLNRFLVAAGLAALTVTYYLLIHPGPIEGHFPIHHLVRPNGTGINVEIVRDLLADAILGEYLPFIVLLFSLYTISGGIRIQGDLRAHPRTNTAFILTGGLLASFVGTTGAAMLLIRPLLETNRERKHVVHTVVFFIFVVCNCGGCLLPIGDPPLFLGYLKGVDFLWTLKLAPQWLLVNGLLLAVYWVWDHYVAYPHEEQTDVLRDETQTMRLRVSGLGLNGPLLLGVVLAVALLDPSKTFPGTDWHPWGFLREVVQLGLVGLSLLLGSAEIRRANRFNYHAIVEVAVLFLGIFITMQPALQLLHIEGPRLGVDSELKFFWYTGGLSSVLDNAPTYVVFFETAATISSSDAVLVAGVRESFLVAISLGAVFMGAMTYIGNGPNFMVRAIAEQAGVEMPSFFGYLRYSASVLLPILVLSVWVSQQIGWVLW